MAYGYRDASALHALALACLLLLCHLLLKLCAICLAMLLFNNLWVGGCKTCVYVSASVCA